jgi:hypothetical protein
MFSAYDVITGEELQIDSYRVDDGDLINIPPEEQPEASQEDGRYQYQIEIDNALKNCKLELYKQLYFPYKGRFMLNVTSTEDDVTYIDLGRLGLLSETSTDAFVLHWGANPTDLDSRLLCYDGSIVGISEESSSEETVRENELAKVSVDSYQGYGPETIVIKKWMNDDNVLSRAHYEFYVNWYKD